MLEVIGVSIAYGGDPVVSGASVAIEPGELVVLTGGNGCGKSTLARAMCAAQLVDEGAVLVDGHDPSAGDLERLRVRELVGYVQQDPRDQIVSSLAYDEVAFGPRNLGLDEAEVDSRVREALSMALLDEYGQRVTTELSGGEQQRLAIAGVLAMRPRYLVLDEPTSQLDPAARAGLRVLFERLAHDEGIGIALVTHDADEIAVADRVVDCEGFQSPSCGDSGCLRGGEDSSRARAAHEPGSAGTLGDVVGEDACVDEPVLALDHVSFARGERRILRDVSLSVRPGEVVLLVGSSGAGKSTLASIAAGLIAPEVGTASVCGRPAVPGSVGIAFQQPEGQFFLDTVYDELAYAPRNAGLGEDEVRERVFAAARSVGLNECMLERSPFELSGGQARRVALASVVSLGAPAVIFDEPTAALDAAGRRAAHGLVSALAREGRGVLVITHDVDEWIPIADRLLTLDGGRLSQDRPEGAEADVSHCDDGQIANVGSATSQRLSGAFGGYIPSSPLSHVDARVKVILLLVATGGVFVASVPWAWAVWGLALAIALGAARMSPIEVVRGVRPVAVILAFTLIANLVSCDGRGSVALMGPVRLDLDGGMRGLAAVSRIMLLVGFSLAVSSSTTGTQISDATVRLLRPAARMGAPVAALGTVLSLALRFIPLVSEELGRIRLAQRARGARFDEGSLIERIRVWGSVLTPLMIGLFRRSDRLADSMAARCYDASAPGRLPAPRPLGPGDRAVLAGGLLVFAVLIAASLIGLGR